MKTTRTWAIAGASAALILVPAGASYAVTTASDGTVPTATERVQLRLDHQANGGPAQGWMYGNGYGDQTQARDQVRDPAQDPAGDQTRDQVRDQLRDTEDCDGTGPTGDGPLGDGTGPLRDGTGRGMMGGYGSGR